MHRGAEHYEKKEQKEHRKALAKLNQGDFKDANKHQFKAHVAAQKAQSLRPPTPPAVMSPTTPPMVVPVAQKAPQNLKGYNFGGLGGGLGGMPAQGQPQSYTQPTKQHKPQPISIPQQFQHQHQHQHQQMQQMPQMQQMQQMPIQHQQQMVQQIQPQFQHANPSHVMSPIVSAPSSVVQQHAPHPHGHPGVHKFKGVVGAAPAGVSSGGAGVGLHGSPLVGASPVQGQPNIMAQPQMILAPQHASKPAAFHPVPQKQRMSPPPSAMVPANQNGFDPNQNNIKSIQPTGGAPNGLVMGMPNLSSGVANGMNGGPQMQGAPQQQQHKVRPAQPGKAPKPQPPPPAPSTVSSERSPTDLAPTLQFTEQNRKVVPHTPQSGDALQLVKKW